MIATIRTWNGFHNGNNVTKIGNVCHLLRFFRNVIKLICFIVMHLLSAYIKKICYFNQASSTVPSSEFLLYVLTQMIKSYEQKFF